MQKYRLLGLAWFLIEWGICSNKFRKMEILISVVHTALDFVKDWHFFFPMMNVFKQSVLDVVALCYWNVQKQSFLVYMLSILQLCTAHAEYQIPLEICALLLSEMLCIEVNPHCWEKDCCCSKETVGTNWVGESMNF